eukprot:1260013-Amphidinium_carterae.1
MKDESSHSDGLSVVAESTILAEIPIGNACSDKGGRDAPCQQYPIKSLVGNGGRDAPCQHTHYHRCGAWGNKLVRAECDQKYNVNLTKLQPKAERVEVPALGGLRRPVDGVKALPRAARASTYVRKVAAMFLMKDVGALLPTLAESLGLQESKAT